MRRRQYLICYSSTNSRYVVTPKSSLRSAKIETLPTCFRPLTWVALVVSAGAGSVVSIKALDENARIRETLKCKTTV